MRSAVYTTRRLARAGAGTAVSSFAVQNRAISVFSTTGIPGAFLGRYPNKAGVDVSDTKQFVNGVPYVEERMSLQEAAQFLTKLDVGAVPVLCPVAEGDVTSTRKVTGMFSERDISRAFGRSGDDSCKLCVRDVMTPDVVACSKSDSVRTILDTMLIKNFRHLPCLDQDGALIGLVSMRDAAWLQAKERLQDPTVSIQGVDDFLAHITDATRF